MEDFEGRKPDVLPWRCDEKAMMEDIEGRKPDVLPWRCDEKAMMEDIEGRKPVVLLRRCDDLVMKLNLERMDKQKHKELSGHLTSSNRKKRSKKGSTKVNGGKLVKRERRQRREKMRKKGSKKDSTAKKNENILTTDSPYYTSVGDANTIWKMEEAPVSRCVVEVPSFRIKVYTSCDDKEGTEDLSDEVFKKRHHKLEIEERRRNRWDRQWEREQRQREKLLQRSKKQRDGGGGDTKKVESLYPSPDQAEFIQVLDTIPVSAFGCPIPEFTESEFRLPWVNGKD